MRTSRFICLVMSIMFCFSVITFGQGTTGEITGAISDEAGVAISGATITVENTGTTTAYKKTVTANEDGYYFFTNVPSGNYKITISANAFRTKIMNVNVVVDKAVSGNVTLNVSNGSVDDFGDSKITEVTIDKTDTSVDTSITEETFGDLPKGTQFTGILKMSPSVRPEPLNGGLQIDGGSGSENRFFFDGQEVTNFRLGTLNPGNNLPFEFIREVQVKSTGVEAEYGGSTGGVVNVVTSGGNDQYHGNFGISFRPGQFQGDPNPILTRFGSDAGEFEYFTPPKDSGTDFFPVASISGPILKDKIWGLFSYAPQIFKTTRTKDYYDTNNPSRSILTTENYESKTTIEQAFGRIDAQPFSSLRVFGTYLWNPTIVDGELPTTALSVGSPFISVAEYADRGGRVNSNTVNGQATWTPFDWMLVNFRSGRTFLNEKLGSYGREGGTRFAVSTGSTFDPCDVIPGRTEQCRGFNTGSNVLTRYDVSTRTTFDADVSFSGIDFAGRHNLKVGYQYNKLYNDIDSGYVSSGYVLLYYGRLINTFTGFNVTPLPLCDLQNIPAGSNSCTLGTARIVRIGTFGEARSDNNAFYGQDSWTIKKRLTLNFGLRFESEDVPTYNNRGVSVSEIKFGWGDKIAPRFGIAYDLTGDGKTKVFGSYGWFYDRFKYELPRSLFGADIFADGYAQITPGRGLSPFDYTFEAMLGGRGIVPGGECPIANPTGYIECEIDRRIPSNLPTTDPFGGSGFIDSELEPMRQTEYTFGIERELGNNFVIAGRYIHKELDNVVEDIGSFNAQGSESFIIGNPGLGLDCEISMQSNLPCGEAERKYDALEITLDKRATKYFFNANYTYSRLFGNYSGLASSDEFGRTSPNSTRSFDLPMLGFNANGVPDNGRLATDRPHVFKAYGGYSFGWNDSGVNTTTVSAFTTVQSGTPLTTQYSLYNVNSSILFERGDLGRTEVFTETDFAVSHRIRFGNDRKFALIPFLEIRNIFNERNEIARDTSISNVSINATQLQNAGCTTCDNELFVFDTLFNQGGIQQFVLDYYNMNPTVLNNTYNQTNLFQFGRDVRFGLNFKF